MPTETLETPQTSVQPTTSVTPPAPAAPVTPEVTINNTAEEIKAAHEQEKTAQPQAAPVVAPKPYSHQITKNSDGTVTVEIITPKGPKEKFTGTETEVLAKVAESRANSEGVINELNGKIPQAPETPAVTPQTPPQAWSPAPEDASKAMDGLLAGNFKDVVVYGLTQAFGGNNPQEVLEAISDLMNFRLEARAQRDMAEFTKQASDFPWSKENTDILFNELKARSIPATPDNLVFAYNALKGSGKIKPVTAVTAHEPPKGHPSPNGAQPVETGYDYAADWTKPIDQLQAEIRAGNNR